MRVTLLKPSLHVNDRLTVMLLSVIMLQYSSVIFTISEKVNVAVTVIDKVTVLLQLPLVEWLQ